MWYQKMNHFTRLQIKQVKTKMTTIDTGLNFYYLRSAYLQVWTSLLQIVQRFTQILDCVVKLEMNILDTSTQLKSLENYTSENTEYR